LGTLRTLAGRIRLAAAVPPGAIALIKVEDVSRLDAAAVVLAELALPLPAGAAAGVEIPFALSVPVPDGQPTIGVRVHVDATASGEVTEGDLLSTRAYPVLTDGAPDQLIVDVVVV
jgi:uncharacterized lipoprotein YbaY